MSSTLGKAAALVESARDQIESAIANPEKFATKVPLTAEEEAHRDDVRNAAMDALADAIASVEKAKQQNKSLKVKEPVKIPAHWKPRGTSNPAAMANLSANPPNVPSLLQLQFTETQPVDDLAKDLSAIAPVMDGFNNALAVDDVQQWNATLESAPMLGIQLGSDGQPSQVYYTATSINSAGDGVEQTWTQFYQLPAEPAQGDTCHCFSYFGNVYAAIGRGLYQKTAKNINDPTIAKAATDNWTLLFNSDWPLVSQNCLPTNNAASLVQFNTFNIDGTVKSTGIVQLGNDSSLSYFGGGAVTASLTFTPWTFVAAGDFKTAPKFEKVTAWDNALWGYVNDPGKAATIYNITPNVVAGSWSINYSTTMKDRINTDFSKYTIVDMTAVDSGLAVSLSDGNIWKWLLMPSQQDNKGTVSANWQVFLKAGNNKYLGCAAPGVVLDLKTLLVYLKSNYIETQMDVLRTIPLMESYCGGHGQMLIDITKDIAAYNAETDPTKKEAIATGAGAEAIHQAQTYGRLVESQLDAINNVVVLMGRESSTVKTSLQAQLDAISLSLAGLNQTLSDKEKELSALQIGFWVSVAGIFVGLGLIIVGLLFPPAAPFLIPIGGILAVAGVVGVAVTGTKAGQVASEIADLKTKIANYTKAQTGLTSVINNVTTMETGYKGLDAFWYNLRTDAATINVATPYGFQLMDLDEPTLRAAATNNNNLLQALKDYVNTLGQQGLTISASPSTALVSHIISGDHDKVHQQLEAAHTNPRELRHAKTDVTVALVKMAEAKRAQGDKDAWKSLLAHADVFNTKALRSLPMMA